MVGYLSAWVRRTRNPAELMAVISNGPQCTQTHDPPVATTPWVVFGWSNLAVSAEV